MSSPKEKKKKENYGKYFLAGSILAILIYIIILMTATNEPEKPLMKQWSKEVEDEFVKSCYGKYRTQISTEEERIRTNSFCKCMLSKMKMKYEESQINDISSEDLKAWDRQCRDEVANGAIY